MWTQKVHYSLEEQLRHQINERLMQVYRRTSPLNSAKVLLFPSVADECKDHSGGDLSLIRLQLILIILQRLELNVIYSLACSQTKPNTS